MTARSATPSPVSSGTTRSRLARVGKSCEITSRQPGKLSGGRNSPPANAMGKSTTWATGTAPLTVSE